MRQVAAPPVGGVSDNRTNFMICDQLSEVDEIWAVKACAGNIIAQDFDNFMAMLGSILLARLNL